MTKLDPRTNHTRSISYLRDGGDPRSVDLSTSRAYSPGERVLLRAGIQIDDGPWVRLTAEVLDVRGDSLWVRTVHECWPLPGLKLLDQNHEMLVSRDEVFGVISVS